MVGRAFPANCGAAPARLASGIIRRKHEWCSDGAKYEAVIPAVPLRSVPTIDVEGKPEKANTTDNTVHQKDVLWKRESEELAALIAEAKDLLNLLNQLDAGCPTSKDPQPPSFESDAFHPPSSVGEQKLMMETVKLEKRARDEVLAMPVMLQNSDRSFSGKMLKVNCGISVIVQEEKASGTETMWEDGDDEVCVLSPSEWNVLQQHSNNKDECAEPSSWKLEKKLERQSSLEPDKDKEYRNVIEPQRISGGTKSDQTIEKFPNCELTETKCRDPPEHGSTNLDECSAMSKMEQDDTLKMFSVDDEAIATNSTNNNDELVFKFELHRLPGQPSSTEICDALQGREDLEVVNGLRGQPKSQGKHVCVLDDVSQGKEKFKVRVVNGLDEEVPLPFTYITNIVYPPDWYQQHGDCEPIGCSCINGCSDSVQCPCVVKNGGEIPFTEKGLIMRARTNNAVHECGASCKCPPSCMNRVSQHGPRFQLEVFKTKSMGWGVRSQSYIMPGSFICEYIGELLGENEADERIGNDEYLFDICHGKSKKDDLALDAAKCGNIGRFINHSCDPNVFAQKVVYDNSKVPHIMFFAGKRIHPRTELRYDYNYSNIRIRDANGNIKRKDCYCGSRKCTGRLY